MSLLKHIIPIALIPAYINLGIAYISITPAYGKLTAGMDAALVTPRCKRGVYLSTVSKYGFVRKLAKHIKK